MAIPVPDQSSEQCLDAVELLLRNVNYIGRVDYHRIGEEAPTIVASGSRDFHHPEKPMTEDTIVGIASMTKSFTSATLLKLWDLELSAAGAEPKFFPDGIDTHISHFMDGLKEKFPKCREAFEQIEKEADYEKITLRDLMNHTHGLGFNDWEKLVTSFIAKGDQKPLELDDAINMRKKCEDAKYGTYYYGNFGYDYLGAIIEVIASEKGLAISFDDAVQKLILEPNSLDHTYTQSKMKALYDADANVSRGCVIVGEIKDFPHIDVTERDFNTKSNCRAASGFKSTVRDLAKFTELAMSAKMFDREEVKDAVLDRSRAVSHYHYGLPTSHHLSMGVSDGKGGLVARGEEVTGNSYARYDPATKEVKVWVAAGEGVTKCFCDVIWKTAFDSHDDLHGLKMAFSAAASEIRHPDMEKKEKIEILERLMSENPQGAKALSRYAGIMQDAITYPRDELMMAGKEGEFGHKLYRQVQEREKVVATVMSSPSPSPSTAVAVSVARQPTDDRVI
jgi:CubicO group peptidase (beta-lactamase class C family)